VLLLLLLLLRLLLLRLLLLRLLLRRLLLLRLLLLRLLLRRFLLPAVQSVHAASLAGLISRLGTSISIPICKGREREKDRQTIKLGFQQRPIRLTTSYYVSWYLSIYRSKQVILLHPA
jgi:hypothetical protein